MSISYYNQLISESYAKIDKYKKQIIGLEGFGRENRNGEDTFSTITSERRKNIANTLCGNYRHPMVRKLDTRLSTAINNTYAYNVLDCFQGIADEITRVIQKLNKQIEEEMNNIKYYNRRICELEEEARRAAEEARRAAEEARRAAEEAKRADEKKADTKK